MSDTETDFCQALAKFMIQHRRDAWIYVGKAINNRARVLRCQQWIRRNPTKARQELILWAKELGVIAGLKEYCPFNLDATLGKDGLRNMVVMIAIHLANHEKDWSLHRKCPKKSPEQQVGRMVFVVERRLDA